MERSRGLRYILGQKQQGSGRAEGQGKAQVSSLGTWEDHSVTREG